MAMVWPCPLQVDAYVAAGREVQFPRPVCPSCAGPLVLWSGYWRHVRAAGRCRKIFVPRVILNRARGGSYVAVGLTGIAIFGVFLFLTYYLQQVKGYSPVASGLAFLPMIACILISSNTSSIVLLPRLGPRTLIAAGMLIGGGGMAYLTQLTVTSSYAGTVLPALLAMGLGFGMIFAPAINTATSGVARQDSACRRPWPGRARGCGVLSAAVVIGETARASRFRSMDACARFTGIAPHPIPVWSGNTVRVRLNRGGNR